MIEKINKEIVSFLMKANLPLNTKVEQEKVSKNQNYKTGRNDINGGNATPNSPRKKTEPVRVEQKVGRNEPCPCGSGKKFKQCHGK